MKKGLRKEEWPQKHVDRWVGALSLVSKKCRMVGFGALKWSSANIQGRVVRGDHMGCFSQDLGDNYEGTK